MGSFAQIRQDEYPATDELQCIAVHIPAGDEYKALLAGFIAFLTDVNSYEDPESAQADGVAATFDEGYAQTNWDGCDQPPECIKMDTSLIVFPADFFVNSGNAFVWVSATAQELAGYWLQNPGQTADQWRVSRWFAPGVWEYQITYVRQTSAGKATFYITPDFATFPVSTTVDFRGTAANNQRFSGSFTIPATGGKYIIGMDGTGASSGAGFGRPISRIEFAKTADL
jgi:hypothetical protein